MDGRLESSRHELRTHRLRLVPLDADGMRLFVEEWPALQRRLGLTRASAWITDRGTLEAAHRHRQEMLRDPTAWLWWTFWQVVLASEAVSIGLVDFPLRRRRGLAGWPVGARIGPSLRFSLKRDRFELKRLCGIWPPFCRLRRLARSLTALR